MATTPGLAMGGRCKVFGVRILEKQERPMKKSASLGNLDSLVNNSTVHHHVDDGSFSDGYVSSKRGKAIQERKRGKPWTEEEHQTFLAGLEKLGKGYPYTLKSPGSFASCALLTNHPSGIPTPRSFPVSFSQEGPSTENVDPPELDLKIGPPPQSPKAASLSPRASGPISVI
ncbi:hypothetical protein GH714_025625 [Hevea brasiliensis]|uniref:Myb-like domain-containing protein n=1 Tax=Hevea brasiliensis TaxID=3981 RepID=A0A6A6MD64_HEVBR|nr:hypothetical protein GH714_025625 [Hevea brasiliensis]